MDLLAVVEHHGYAVTAVVLFLACCGLPLPLSVVLLVAGAAAHAGVLNLGLVIAIACTAALCGDTLMYLGGRYTGWWLLAGLCRLSMNAETCIFGAANLFYERGPKTLVVAKFIPGLSTVAAPLAGSLNMRLMRFLRLDAAGVLLYVSAWTLAGYVCSRFLREVIGWVARVGHATTALVLLLAVFYAIWLTANWVRDTRFSAVERVRAPELLDRMHNATPEKLLVIADVMGKGVLAAMFAAILRAVLRATPELNSQPAALLTRVNQLLFDELSGVDMFITAQLVFVDAKTRKLVVGSAGHCPLLIADGSGLKSLSPEGMPLGILADTVFASETVELPTNCRVLLYTDGLTEAMDAAGERYGQDRLTDWFEKSQAEGRPARALQEELANKLTQFQLKTGLNDDQTFLIMTG